MTNLKDGVDMATVGGYRDVSESVANPRLQYMGIYT